MYSAGAAAVQIVPSLQGFSPSLARQIESPARTAGALAASNLGRSASRALPTQLVGVSRAFDTVYGRAEKLATSSGSAIGRSIGRGTTAALGPLGRLRDGFFNASAAASVFSGRAGTIGGVLRKGFDQAAAHVDATSGRLHAFGATAGAAIGRVTRAVGTFAVRAGGLAAGATIAVLGAQGVRMAMGLQQAEAALTGLYGSADKAQKMLARLRTLAKSSPIDYQTWIQGAESLAYMGYEGDRAVTILKRIETAMVASGKGSEAFQSVTDAMLSMVNQGKASADEINRMSQAGFPAWEMLANHMHVSIADIRKQVSTGKLSIEDMIKAMEEGGGPTFAKMAAAAKQGGATLQNTFIRLKNNVVLALGEMMRPMVERLTPVAIRAGQAVQRAFDALPELLSRIGQSAGFQLLVGGLRDLWGTITESVMPALGSLWQAIQPVVQVFGGAVLLAFRAVAGILRDVIGPALSAVASWLVPLRPVILGIAVAFAAWYGIGAIIGGVTTAVLGVPKAIKAVRTAWTLLSAAFTASPIGFVIALLAGLTAAVIWAWNNCAGFRAVVMAVWNGIGTVARWVWNNVLKPTFSAITSVVRGVGDVFNWLWRNIIKPVWDGISGAIEWAWNHLIKPVLDAFSGAGRKIGEAFEGMKKVIKGVFDTIWGIVKKPIQITLDIVWNKSLRAVVNAARWIGGSPPLPEIKLAQGGTVPGYAPGKDRVHALLSPGEGVLVPELVRLLGGSNIIDKLNQWAMRRQGRSSGATAAGQFRAGGVVRAAPTPAAARGNQQAAAAPTLTPDEFKAVTDAATVLNTALLALAETINDVLRPAWQALSTQLSTVVVPALVVAERHLGVRMTAANTRLSANTTQLSRTLATLWTAITSRIVASANTIGTRQRTLQTQLGASWQTISNAVWASVNAQNRAMTALQGGMGKTRQSMTLTADWAHGAYDRLREAAAGPIRWVLNWPFARGLVAAWNQLNREFNFRRAIAAPAVPFASGGRVHGPGTGTSDSILSRLSNGEFVVRERIARIVRPFLEALNKGQPEALQATGARGYADGGVVANTGSALNAALLRGMQFAKAHSGEPYVWGGVGPRGFDCSGFMSAITNVLRGESNPYRRLGVARSQPWPGFRSGLGSAFATGFSNVHTAGTLAGTNVESGGSPSRVKFGVGAAGADDSQFPRHAFLPVVGGRFVSGGAGGINPEVIVNDAFARTYQLVNETAARFPGNTMADFGRGVAKRGADRVKGAALTKLSSLLAVAGGATAGSPEVVAAVRAVASRYGWGSGPQWNALSWIISRESGWNPAAANPNSSARGLFQKMTSIHGAIEPTVPGQAEWGMDYIKGRFGSPLAAQRYWQTHGSYDDGGWLPPGLSTVYNGTGRPEAVFTADQLDDLPRQRSDETAPHITVNARTDANPVYIAHAVDRRLAMSTRL